MTGPITPDDLRKMALAEWRAICPRCGSTEFHERRVVLSCARCAVQRGRRVELDWTPNRPTRAGGRR